MGSRAAGSLDRGLCQVVGVNLNYSPPSGNLYHIQVEDRGPVIDRVSEREVRRLNLIVYSNYGEPNTHIVHGCDRDFDDIRTAAHNRFIEAKVKELAKEARRVVEEHESRQIARIKGLLREYYLTKNDSAKKEFEAANARYPFLFSRAWRELKEEKARPAVSPPPQPEAEPEAPASEAVYPLDRQLREQVMEIERVIAELGRDLKRLKERGTADDILLQTCRKLVRSAKEALQGAAPSVFHLPRLDSMRLDRTRSGLLTTWREVKSRLLGGACPGEEPRTA